MAITPFKTFAAGEVLTASDLNSSFSQITTNGEDLAWPATKGKDFNGNELILDADGDTSITADTDDQIDFKIGGVDHVVFTAGLSKYTSVDAGATAGPALTLHRDSASPAALDIIGILNFDGEDDAAGTLTYASISPKILGTAAGNEGAELRFTLKQSGNDEDILRLIMANNNKVQIQDFVADAVAGPNLTLLRDSASPAALDIIGILEFDGKDDAAGTLTYASISTKILGTAAGNEGAELRFTVKQSGNDEDFLRLIATPNNKMQLQDFTADAVAGPVFTLIRDSASPADADFIGKIDFSGKDSGDNATVYAEIGAQIDDVTDTTEDASLILRAMVGGSLTDLLDLSGAGGAVFSGDAIVNGTLETGAFSTTGLTNGWKFDGSKMTSSRDGSTSQGQWLLFNTNGQVANFKTNGTSLEVDVGGTVALTIDSSQNATFSGDITSTSTDAGATAGPDMVLYRNSASPAVLDLLGRYQYDGENSAGTRKTYCSMDLRTLSVTDTDETADWRLKLLIKGTERDILRLIPANNNKMQLADFVDDAVAGPDLVLYRDSANPADADFIGTLMFDAENSAAAQTTYAEVACQIDDVTDSTEDASIILRAMKAGSITDLLDISGLAFVSTADEVFLNLPLSAGTTGSLFEDGSGFVKVSP